MEYLKKEEIAAGLEIEEGNEVIKLIEPAGEEETFINEDWADPKKNFDINDDTMVMGKQRWLVEITPKDKFLKPRRTHRSIEYYIETYRQRNRSMIRLSEIAHEDRRMQLSGTLKATDHGISHGGEGGISRKDSFKGIY